MELGRHAPTLTVPISKRDHVLGPADAPATLLAYGDFECPHCGRAYPIVKELMRQLRGRLRFAYRHLPIGAIHPHAGTAAEAAEAAGAQGKFWAMHDALFENQDALEPPDLRRYAAEIGLDLARFDDDMDSARYAARVREDFRSGVRSGVNGTPTFFVNGVRHNGPYDYESLLSALVGAAPRLGTAW
jgi:protein-disulfide isomerase